MDSEDISASFLKAGQEYLSSLRKLKLNPEGLLWARLNEIQDAKNGVTGEPIQSDNHSNDWHLVLVTSLIDEGGPLALQELLFRAYQSSATPAEISPFIVEVMSAKSPFVAHLLNALNNPVGPVAIIGKTAEGKEFRQETDPYAAQTLIGGLWFDRKWIYQMSGMVPRFAERKRQWRQFKQTVSALAA